MGTVSKALGLLDVLSQSGAPLGLTEIARLADFDKATTRRLLLELASNGFVEQDFDSRAYALGPALQMLGRVREDRFPLFRTAQPFVRMLAEKTGETAHAAEYCAGALVSVCIELSAKTIRVNLDEGQKLPLHATASGIAFLAASPPAMFESVVKRPLVKLTSQTPGSREELGLAVSETRMRGYSVSSQTMEEGVHSVGAAILNLNGKPVGTVAVALPVARATQSLTAEYGLRTRQSAEEISQKLFGRRAAHWRKAS